MNTQVNLLFAVFGLMIGVLLISLLISRLVLMKLTVRRALPDVAVVGQKAVIGYEFANDKRVWPSLSVTVAELDGVEAFRRQPHAYLLHAAARTSASCKVEVTPKRRGAHQLGKYQIATSFPFGFVKRAVVRYQEDTLMVFPPLARVDVRVLKLLRSAETAGITVRPRRGGEDEVYGVKEYRPGESPRLIHWRRSARSMATGGALVAREMTRVSPPRVMIMVDTRLHDRSAESHAAVERAIAVAASLASEALEQGLMVGVQAPSPGVGDGYVRVMPNRGKRHRKEVLSALARLPVNEVVELRSMVQQVSRELRAGTSPVLVTPHELEQNLAEQARGGWVVLSAMSPQVRAWFRFGDDVDFAMAMPADQQPDYQPEKGTGEAGGEGKAKAVTSQRSSGAKKEAKKV